MAPTAPLVVIAPSSEAESRVVEDAAEDVAIARNFIRLVQVLFASTAIAQGVAFAVSYRPSPIWGAIAETRGWPYTYAALISLFGVAALVASVRPVSFSWLPWWALAALHASWAALTIVGAPVIALTYAVSMAPISGFFGWWFWRRRRASRPRPGSG